MLLFLGYLFFFVVSLGVAAGGTHWPLVVWIFIGISARTKAYQLLFIPWLWIPRDEMNPAAYEINMPLVMNMPPWVEALYMKNLTWRRQIAHNRDLRRS